MNPGVESLAGRVALVTGGASGLGRSTAALLARRGARVVVSDVMRAEGETTAALIREAGHEAVFQQADTTSSTDMAAAVAACFASFGRLDIAVNNAGIEGHVAPVAEQDEAAWARVIAVNLTGVFLSLRHEIPAMLQSGGGAIVNVGSTASLCGVAGMSAYVASKHGLLGLTRSAALEYADQGVRVNAVLPGSFRTPMSERLFGVDDVESRLQAITPMRRLGSLDEIAEAIVWLCSDAASFVTGTGLSVDGGKRAA